MSEPRFDRNQGHSCSVECPAQKIEMCLEGFRNNVVSHKSFGDGDIESCSDDSVIFLDVKRLSGCGVNRSTKKEYIEIDLEDPDLPSDEQDKRIDSEVSASEGWDPDCCGNLSEVATILESLNHREISPLKRANRLRRNSPGQNEIDVTFLSDIELSPVRKIISKKRIKRTKVDEDEEFEASAKILSDVAMAGTRKSQRRVPPRQRYIPSEKVLPSGVPKSFTRLSYRENSSDHDSDIMNSEESFFSEQPLELLSDDNVSDVISDNESKLIPANIQVATLFAKEAMTSCRL